MDTDAGSVICDQKQQNTNRMTGLAGKASPFCAEVKELMKLKNSDRLHQAKDLITGLRDIMFYMETAEQDKLIPITVLCPFEAVLEKVSSLFEEMKEEEG